jgi:hypothetical protein
MVLSRRQQEPLASLVQHEDLRLERKVQAILPAEASVDGEELREALRDS